MKKLFKLVSLSLVIALSCGLFTGCGSDSASTGGKPYEIVWYFPSTAPTSDLATVEAAINAHITPKINATLKLMPTDWGTYEAKMNPMIAGRQKFDIAFSANWLLSYAANVKRGAFAPITKSVDAKGADIIAEVGKESLEALGYKNELYGVPVVKDNAHNFGFIYRKDLVEKYNIDVQNIKSFEDLIPALDIIKANEPEVTPLFLQRGRSPQTLLQTENIALPMAMRIDKNLGKVENLLEDEDYQNALKLSRKLYTSGYTRKSGGIGDDYNKLIKEGQIFATLERLKPGKVNELSTGNYEYIQVDITEPIRDTGDLSGSVMCISATSKQPEKVLEFLNLLYTDKELNNLVVFGVEGKHYSKISENVIKPIEGSGYGFDGSQWMFGNTFLQYTTEKEDKDKHIKMREFNKNAKLSPYMGLQLETDEVKTQLAACSSVREEYEANLEVGLSDPAVVMPEYIEKSKQSGSDDIKEFMQKEVDKQYKK